MSKEIRPLPGARALLSALTNAGIPWAIAVGDVTLDKEKPKVHAYVVIGKADATAHGGHLVEGHVRPTLEILATESLAHLRRRFDPDSGLSLIDPSDDRGPHA